MKNKVLAVLFSVAVAVGLWMYVITVVSPESEKTYYEIPVVLQNKELLAQRGLMIVSDSPKVTLTLKSDRATLNDLNENNINVIADLSTVEKDGNHNLTYTISYPGNVSSGSVSVMSSSTEMITLKVENRIKKDVPLVVSEEELKNQLDKDYVLEKIEMFKRENNQPVPVASVEISGPESVVGKITQAVINDVDLKGKTETFDNSYVYALCDKDGKEVNAEKVTTNVGLVQVTAHILKEKTVTIVPSIIPSDGVTAENVAVTLGQQSVVIRGKKDRVDSLPASVTVEVKLAEHWADETGKKTYQVELNDIGLAVSDEEIRAGKQQFDVIVEFVDIETKQIEIPVATVNLPQGYNISSKAETVTVTVRGAKSVVSKLTARDFTAQVDCTNVTVGTNDLQATVTCQKTGVEIQGKTHSVTLDVAAKK